MLKSQRSQWATVGAVLTLAILIAEVMLGVRQGLSVKDGCSPLEQDVFHFFALGICLEMTILASVLISQYSLSPSHLF